MAQKPKSNKPSSEKDTSWHEVATWYDDLLQNKDTFQANVIAPNLLRVMEIKKGEKVLDVACGQGFFSEAFAHEGAEVVGIDLAKDLIAIAKARGGGITYEVSSADSMPVVKTATKDKAACVLALQNIHKAKETFEEVSRVLKSSGEFTVVLNHPAFRVPQGSSWGTDKEGTQYRRVYNYMSEKQITIDMHPGKKGSPKTTSFHRPLQWYVKHGIKAGFALIRLEEWISHRESQVGPHKVEEDRMRKEIPLFMCLQFKKIS